MNNYNYTGLPYCENCGERDFDFTRIYSNAVRIAENGGLLFSQDREPEMIVGLSCSHCGLPVRKSKLVRHNKDGL